MTIRLDTYPEAQIASHMHPASIPSTPSPLCCLLHTGALPNAHQLQVWVGGTQQVAEPEGAQQVFSWQCAENSEMSIHLMQHGRLAKAWRGWWKGGSTIAHTGTLAVQVFCAGVLQPAGLTPSPTPVASSVTTVVSDQQNGSHPQASSTVLTWPALPDTSAPLLPTTNVEPADDLWSTPPQAPHSSTTETREEEGGEKEIDQNGPEEEEGWEDAEREDEGPEEEAWEDAEPGDVPEGPAETEHPETPATSPTLPPASAPARTMLATVLANTVWSQTAHQEALDRLTTLLTTMPTNTILVDLRQHPATPRTRRVGASSGPQKLGLSKELLRTLYGGRYWDRGSLIQTSRRLESAHPVRWCHVVINPEDPEGLGALVTALTQGFSLVLLDGETTYAASPRAAVLAQLRQRVANLLIGSCA